MLKNVMVVQIFTNGQNHLSKPCNSLIFKQLRKNVYFMNIYTFFNISKPCILFVTRL